MDLVWEKARDVGRLLAQSPEYEALKRANTRLSEDTETVSRVDRLNELQDVFARALQSGAAPPDEQQAEYERLVGDVQASTSYQAFEAARTNFDKLMMRVYEEIARGIEAGAQSRIILPH